MARFVPNANFNTAIITIVTIIGGYFQNNMSEKQDKMAAWQAKRDSVNKVMYAKMDSIHVLLKKKKYF